MRPRVDFIDPETSVVIDYCEYESIIDETDFHGIGLVHSVIGIDVDPADLLERIKICPTYRRSLLALLYEPMFQGLHGGQFDAIAEARVQAAQHMCRIVDARIAAEAALSEILS